MSFDYRLATPSDNEAILAFTGRHAMQAGLQLRFDRSPDFFALPNAHSPRHDTWLILCNDRIVALGSVVVRPGYIDGRAEPVVYLSDLRVAPDRAVAGRWRRFFRELMARTAADSHARYAFCAVIRANRLAHNSIVQQRALGFRHLRGYATVSVFGRKPFRGHNAHAVREATAADFDSLREFLDRGARDQVFGVVFDSDELRRRLDLWSGLAIEHFLLAVDPGDEITGCVAPWDYSALKRVVIDHMPTAAHWLRRVINVLAPLHRGPRLASPPGAILPDVALSHLAVRGQDPKVFSALLYAAMVHIRRHMRAATVSLCLYDDSPLWAVLEDYWHYAVPMDLYSLRIDSDAPELLPNAPCLPGFEFYLV